MSRRSIAIIAVMTVAVLLVGAGVVYAYDASRDDHIAQGMRIGGVDVGGLNADQANAKLRTQLVTPLERAVTVDAGDKHFRLTAREARVQVNSGELVDEAVSASREGSFLSRAWRDVSGGKIDRQVAPTIAYSKSAVQRLADRVRVTMSRQAEDATVDITTTNVAVKESVSGRTIDAKKLRAEVQAALVDVRADRRVRAPLKKVAPKVTTSQLATKYPSIITVDRGKHRLRLFKDLKLKKTYGVAVGMAGLETPAGEYTIQNMAENPSWHVPDSAWAGDLAGKVIPPGPENPIKARWMGIYDGAGIHGTDSIGSIGTNASHGCVRMRIPDVEELYDQVKVGTPVLIV
jgi:lipoprotein-anchoring transpeptidase ErfK/SrfK